ncbi:MAG: glycoside hydrolase family 76 protein [Clostridiales bacterium]|nr:glycoside hydrolase family 76 protein [Clostridiales bacterium]
MKRLVKLGAAALACILILCGTMAGGLFYSTRPAASDPTAQLAALERLQARAQTLSGSYYRQYYNEDKETLYYYQSAFSNRASTCWEYIGLISLTYKLALQDDSYLDKMDGILAGLNHYRKLDGSGRFAGYVVDRAARQHGTDSDGIAYDDNMWLGRDFAALYDLTGEERYRTLAVEIGDFLIENAFVDLPDSLFLEQGWQVTGENVGSFYWDYRHDALHTCSTGPAAQFLAALYRITGEDTYLQHAKSAYNFLQYLENEDGVFDDLMRFEKDESNRITGILGKDASVYAYNSGSPITAAVELYQITGEARYLEDAQRWARQADAYFAQPSGVAEIPAYPVDTTTWFNLILLNGYVALAPYDSAAETYIAHMQASIDYAYENHRSRGIFGINRDILPANWIDGGQGLRAVSLDVSAAAEIYATLYDWQIRVHLDLASSALSPAGQSNRA